MQELISWKHSFKRLNEEYGVAKKKRQALDNLLNAGRISQSTHDMFNREIDDTIGEIERQQKALLEKMAAKVVELEGQVKTMEVLLANFEIRHVTGEIDEEIYQRESDLLYLGLETAKNELDEVKEATDQLARGDLTFDKEAEPEPQENEPIMEEVKISEETPAPTEEEAATQKEETVVETIAVAEVASNDTKDKVEEKQQT